MSDTIQNRMEMKKILCPVDFSPAAINAVNYAAKLAQDSEAQLELFNVQSVFDRTPEEVLMGSDLTRAAVRDQLEQTSNQVSRTFHISCYADVTESTHSVTEMISLKAEAYDLIVMGANGPDDIYSFLTGSHAYKVMRKAKAPLIMVPKSCIYSKLRKIVYAYDYLRDHQLPISDLVVWASVLGSEITVLEVMEESYSVDAELELKLLQRTLADRYQGVVQLTFDTIHSANVAGSINSYVVRNEADALAFYSHHYNLLEKIFHKSVLKQITVLAEYPVFVFHV
jgi:nucleotide-binding universal stress UspA family protein